MKVSADNKRLLGCWVSLQVLVFVLLISLSISKPVIADDTDDVKTTDQLVSLTADVWCPYTCASSEANRGLMVDVVEASFRSVGIQVKYNNTVWNRALQNTEKGVADIVLGVADTDVDMLYMSNRFSVFDITAFIYLRDQEVDLSKPSDLNNYRIGRIAEYIYDGISPWEAVIQSHQNAIQLSTESGEVGLLKLLFKNRIDVAVTNLDLAKFYLSKIGRLDDVSIIAPKSNEQLYLGFTKSPRGKLLLQKFELGFVKLQATPELAAIFSKYNIDMPNKYLSTSAK